MILSHKSIFLLALGIILTMALIFPTLIWMLKVQKKYSTIKFSFKHRLTLGAIGVVLMIVFTSIQIVPTNQAAHLITQQKIINGVIHNGKIGITFMIISVLIGPIMEEFLCRFLLIGPNPCGDHYIPKWRYFTKIVFSSIIFALLHLAPNLIVGNLSGLGIMLLNVIPHFVAGLILAYLYVHTQDIRVPIFTHIVDDLIGVIIIFIA